MDTRRAPLDEREQKIADAWVALFTALGCRRFKTKGRGREIGVRGVGGSEDGWTTTPGRLLSSYKFGVELFLDAKALRDAKRTRVGVR